MKLNIQKFEVNPFGELVYVVSDETTKSAMIIDPGMMTPAERSLVVDYLEENNLRPELLLLTHIHLDHVVASDFLCEKYGLTAKAGSHDSVLSAALPDQARRFGMGRLGLSPLKNLEFVSDGDLLDFAGGKIKVLATPGHSLGSLTYYLESECVAFVGDTIFNCSIGRTDLPGGDFGQLADSIRTKIYTLPDNTVLYPGHGPATSVGYEKDYNPYVRP